MQRPAEGWHAGWPGRYADATPKPPTHGDENHPAPAPPASGARADPQRNASARPGEVRRGWQAAPQHDGAVTGNEAGEAVAQAPRRGRHGSDASQGGMSATPTAVAGGHRSRDQTGWIGPAPGAGAAYGEGGGEIDAAEVMVRPEAPRDGVANTAPRLDRMSRLQARGAEPAAPAPGREAFAARPIASDERTSHQPGSMRAGGYVPASNEAMPMAGYRPLAAPRDGAMQALAPQPYRLPAVPAAAPSTPRDAISPGRESSGGDDRVRGSERERK
jgi:hypothetical protein